MNMVRTIAAVAAAAGLAGCIQLKTESEIKPIHITMDVNLKVDKGLDSAFAEERKGASVQRGGEYSKIRALLDRKVAGFTNLAMLEARAGATEEDRILLAESNIRRRRRFEEVAKESGASLETVQRRHMSKLRTSIPAGSGVWMQADDGSWLQR